jgi:hypothetical protein
LRSLQTWDANILTSPSLHYLSSRGGDEPRLRGEYNSTDLLFNNEGRPSLRSLQRWDAKNILAGCPISRALCEKWGFSPSASGCRIRFSAATPDVATGVPSTGSGQALARHAKHSAPRSNHVGTTALACPERKPKGLSSQARQALKTT